MDAWSADEIREMQDSALHAFITERVYPFHPHYRRLFDESGTDPASVKSVDDLQKLPFTYKEDIAPGQDDPDNPRHFVPVSYTHLRAHETDSYLVCRLLLEKKKKQ